MNKYPIIENFIQSTTILYKRQYKRKFNDMEKKLENYRTKNYYLSNLLNEKYNTTD